MKVRFVVPVVLAACFSHLALAETIFPAVDCVIVPSKTVDISAAVSGVIKTLYAERSGVVRNGELLAELDSRVEQANVELSRVRAAMSAEISAEEVNLKYDRLQSRRVNDLNQKSLTSVQNKDEAARLEKVTYWRLKQAKDTLRTRQLELARAMAQLEETKVYSTLDGVVAQVYKTEGEYIEDQPVMRLVQLNPLHIEAVLPMEHYGQVQKNMLGGVFSELDPNDELQAKVIIIDPIGDTASGTFGVRLTIDNPENKIPAGMKCVLKLNSSMPDQTVEEQSSTEIVSAPLPAVNIQAIEKEPKYSAAQSKLLSQEKLPVANNLVPQNEPTVVSALPVTADALQRYSFGPFKDESILLNAGELLTKHGYVFSRRVEDSSVIKGYLVLLAEGYEQSKRQLMMEFGQRGVSGMMILPRRSYNGRLSFGAYNGPEMANNRQESLTQKGIRSEVITRRKGKAIFWLDVDAIAESRVTAILDQITDVYN
ncbi:efflux RND transporter periplasmic adaptor subunit [Neptunomonas japonica]|uniref:efflux RND transporter periplasmic adaptor subunit n=1 Tax=Neptunomonas japonica TaxID=417574 RepID=UPI00042074FD|nr:efflux RND transporter periplasmic adaptor subunit [Neptunomonas japonica]